MCEYIIKKNLNEKEKHNNKLGCRVLYVEREMLRSEKKKYK